MKIHKKFEMKKTIELHSEQDTQALAKEIVPLLKAGDILFLYGELGSGKTYFVKQLGRFLEITDEISSPSFVLLNEYKGGRLPLYHLDFFRLRDEEELLELGIPDIVELGVTAIEWPELAERLLPDCTLALRFHFDGIRRWVEIASDKQHKAFIPLFGN